MPAWAVLRSCSEAKSSQLWVIYGVAESRCVFQNYLVWNALVSHASLHCGHDLMTEFAQQLNRRMGEILVCKQTRHLRDPSRTAAQLIHRPLERFLLVDNGVANLVSVSR